MKNQASKLENMKISPLQHIILGVVVQAENHDNIRDGVSGYTLTGMLEGVWKVSHQQVYRDLKGLQSAEVLEYETIPQEGKPDKKNYTVTEKGRELYRHLNTLEHTVDKINPNLFRTDLIAQLALGNMSYFQSMKERLEEQIQQLEEKIVNGSEMDLFNFDFEHLVYERDKMMCEQELRFITKALIFLNANKNKPEKQPE